MSRKVAIVGFAPSTRDLAPYNNPEWEIWVLNEYKAILPAGGATNITKHFELHHRGTVLASKRDPSYLQSLKDSTIPIYMCEKHDDIPMSVEYPINDIITALNTDYFTNSISYMVAMAVYEKVDEIAIYGVDMAQDEEYAKERPSVEYFIGWARAAGIPVYIPKESDICKAPFLYGFQEESASKICKTIDPKLNDLITRRDHADVTADEAIEYIDFRLKKYLIEIAPVVAGIQESEKALRKLQEEFAKATTFEEQQKINNAIIELQNNTPAITNALYPAHDILMGLWQNSQQLKAAKKERLYLAGAADISQHLRVQLCPFD